MLVVACELHECICAPFPKFLGNLLMGGDSDEDVSLFVV